MVFGEGIIDLSDYQLNDVVNVEYVSYSLTHFVSGTLVVSQLAREQCALAASILR